MWMRCDTGVGRFQEQNGKEQSKSRSRSRIGLAHSGEIKILSRRRRRKFAVVPLPLRSPLHSLSPLSSLRPPFPGEARCLQDVNMGRGGAEPLPIHSFLHPGLRASHGTCPALAVPSLSPQPQRRQPFIQYLAIGIDTGREGKIRAEHRRGGMYKNDRSSVFILRCSLRALTRALQAPSP